MAELTPSDHPSPALLLQGRRLLITGGARGLGLAFAQHLGPPTVHGW